MVQPEFTVMTIEIHNQVIKAMRRSCEYMARFSGERAKLINAEYLFVVEVAKQIDGLNNYYGQPYKIFLEKSRKLFSRDCLPVIKRKNWLEPGGTIFRETSPYIQTRERIDIAIYEEHSDQPFPDYYPSYAIELKAFNPSRKLVLKDLKRNLEYFKIRGKTGKSVLKSTIFAALHSSKKAGNVAIEESEALKIKSKYQNWLSELGHQKSIEMSISTHIVSKEHDGELEEECGYQVLNADSVHLFIGVVVEFRSKS